MTAREKIVEAVYNRFNEQVFWDGKRREVKAVIRHQMQCLAQYFLGKRRITWDSRAIGEDWKKRWGYAKTMLQRLWQRLWLDGAIEEGLPSGT